jgi:spore maturation protein CgeB
MKLIVLGLTLSSSWGNGHATTYRALLGAFARRGHEILFLERDVPWYAANRDLARPDFCDLEYYSAIADLERWREQIAAADAVIVGSYVPDGIEVGRFVQAHGRGVAAFYDIDTPVTLASLSRGDCAYLSPEIIPRYQLYLSFTGGPTLGRIEREYGCPAARPLYCSVDPASYRPLDTPRKKWDLTYLGTYSPDRQPTLERLLIEPARRSPGRRFAIAGPQYPAHIRWGANIDRIEHLSPADHAEFYNSSRFTLNVTRADMITAGWSPSVRLFEAAACGTPILSDKWAGLDALFEPDREIILAETSEDALAALMREASAIGRAARERVLAAHTAAHRAIELERHLVKAGAGASSSLKRHDKFASKPGFVLPS